MGKSKPALYGLLLVGGKSSRMGSDKAQLVYRDTTPEWKRLHTLLTMECEQVFLCHREDQNFQVPSIIDPADGPLKAIQSAQHAHPEVAWLVIACDLPLLDRATLQKLIRERDFSLLATCYASPVDSLPEPLCCIYEPQLSPTINQALDGGDYCPRCVLTDAKLISLDYSTSLLNANTPADKVEIEQILKGTQMEKTLTLQYFAQLRDFTNCDTEEVTTKAATASGLYDELRARYAFTHKQKQLMLAINDEFSPWEQPLKPGDTVVFIPPVAGG